MWDFGMWEGGNLHDFVLQSRGHMGAPPRTPPMQFHAISPFSAQGDSVVTRPKGIPPPLGRSGVAA